MTDFTLAQRLDEAAAARRREEHDRARILRLGKLFVLAVGVLLVLVVATTVYDLVSTLIGDAFAAPEPA
jgi:hypothetical protein